MILKKLEELEDLITVPNVDKQSGESINAMKILNLIVEIRGLVKNNAVLPHVVGRSEQLISASGLKRRITPHCFI